jgi:hypothetical protein
LRETSAMSVLLAVHLALVASLLVTLPYAKFAHAAVCGCGAPCTTRSREGGEAEGRSRRWRRRPSWHAHAGPHVDHEDDRGG